MIKSMTGYGRGEAELFERKFVVEIKSVNHRYNEINVKIPRVMSSFEDKVKKIISNTISRGKTDVYITFQSFSKKDVSIRFNQNLADSFVSIAEKIDSRYDFDQGNYFDSLLSFPDILTVDSLNQNDETLGEMWETLLLSLNSAVSNINNMRSIEGLALKEDIILKNNLIRDFTNNIESISPKINEDLKEKVFARVSELLGSNFDESRVLLEVTLLSDKMCIDEELIRLKSHISQLYDILNEGGVCGRKLDFLIQEFNREVNTIGSKSNNIEITKLSVLLKTEIEKIREQVQNIE